MVLSNWLKKRGLLLALASTFASHGASMNSHITYYDLSAEDLAEIRQQIASEGPLRQGRHYSMSGMYSFRWQAQVEKTSNGCRALEPTLALKAELVMPRWISQGQATFEEQSTWLNYITAAQSYHQQISHIITQGADDFVYQVKEMRANHCQQLEALIDAKGRAAVATTQKHVRRFQRRTAHGQVLGLRLP